MKSLRYLCVLLAIFGAVCPVHARSQTTRTTRELELARGRENADLLWTQSLEFFDQGNDPSARQSLEKFLTRFPAHPQNHLGRLLLSVVFLRTGASAEALPVLRMVSETAPGKGKGGAGAEFYRARVLMGQAYLNLKKWHEAELVARELAAESVPVGPRTEALLIQAESRLSRHGKSKRPSSDWDLSLSSARGLWRRAIEKSELPVEELGRNPAVLARITPGRIELKQRLLWGENRSRLEKCTHFLKDGPLDEAMVRAQLEQRGICLAQALGELKELFLIPNEGPSTVAASSGLKWQMDFLKAAADDWHQGFLAFARRAGNPPLPHGKRSPEELKIYFFELEPILEPVVKEWAHRSLEVIEAWKTQSAADPQKKQVSPSLSPLLEMLRGQLTGRLPHASPKS